MGVPDSPGIDPRLEPCAGRVCLLAPCHPAAGLRALVDNQDCLVLACGRCDAPLLTLRDWGAELPLPSPAGGSR